MFDPKITEIKSGPKYKLSASLDYDCDPTQSFPVLLFVPDTDKPEHYHIKLTPQDACSLRDWLTQNIPTVKSIHQRL